MNGAGETSPTSTAEAEAAPAIALAMARSAPNWRRTLPVDLLHSKLAEPPKHRFGRRTAWGAVAAAVAVVLLGLLIWDLRTSRNQVQALRSEMEVIKPQVDRARQLAQRLAAVEGHYSQRPPVLDPLREVTLALPERGTLYITSLTFQDSMRGVIVGRASDQGMVLQFVDRLNARGAFSDVKTLDMRDAGGNMRETAFSISFVFAPGRRS